MKKIIASLATLLLLQLSVAQVSYFPWSDNVIAPPSYNGTPVFSGSDITVDMNNKPFYIGSDSRVHQYYIDAQSQWQEVPLNTSAPLAYNKSGIVFDALGKCYYVATTGYIQQFIPPVSGGPWSYWSLNNFYSGTYVAARNGKLAVSFPGGYVKIYYVGTDNYLRYIQWTDNGWITGKLSQNSSAARADSPLATDANGNVFFIDASNKICVAYQNGGLWYEVQLNQSSTSARTGSDVVVDEYSHVYYVGTDHKIHQFVYSGSAWYEGVLNSSAPIVKPSTQFTYNNGNILYCANAQNRIYAIYWDGCKWDFTTLNNVTTVYPQLNTLWATQYLGGQYKNSYYADNTGKIHILSPGIDVYTNPYVYVKEKKLMLGTTPFYSKGINYFVDYNHDTKPGSPTLGAHYFSRLNLYCGDKNVRCTNNPTQAVSDIDTDFQRLHNLGYNTIRMIGFGFTAAHCGDSLDSNIYIMSKKDTLLGNADIGPEEILIDNNSMNTFLSALEDVLQAAANNQLKVIICVGLGNGNKNSAYPAYENAITAIANHFKNDPTLMAIDIFNEPIYIPQCSVFKEQVCSNTKSIYNSVRGTGSKTLLTIGLAAKGNEEFIWDPAAISVDFFTPHFYNCGVNESCNQPINVMPDRMNNIKSDIYYFSQILDDKPWMIGEFGFSADMYDPNDLSSPSDANGTMQQLYTLAQDVTTWVNDAGASGFLWWNYHDTHDSGSSNGEYMGIYSSPSYPTNIANDVLKTYNNTSFSSILTGAASGCSTTPLVPPSTYYDYDYSTNNFILTGKVVDINNVGIKNAFVLAYLTGTNYVEFTYTDNNGDFAIKTNICAISLGVTAPGMSVYNTLNPPIPTYTVATYPNIVLTPMTCTPYEYQRLSNQQRDSITKDEPVVYVFPNPSDGNFHVMVNGASDQNLSYEIFSLTGEKMKNGIIIKDALTTVDLSGYANGIYLIKIFSGRTHIIKKIVKQ